MKYIRMIDNVLFCHRGVRDYFVGAIRVPVDRQRDLGIYLHEGIKEEQI